MKKLLLPLLISCAFLCVSCYHMPTEDDYPVMPTTNNPTVTHEKPNPFPSMGY